MVKYYISEMMKDSCCYVKTLEVDQDISEHELLKFCRECVESCYTENDTYPRYLMVAKSDTDLIINLVKCYWLNFSEESFWLETISPQRLNSIVLNPDWFNSLLKKIKL